MTLDFIAALALRTENPCLCAECGCRANTRALTVCKKCEQGAHLPDFPCTVSPIVADADIAV